MATTQKAQPQNVDLFGNSTLTPRDLMQQTLAQIMQDTATQTAGADPRTQGVSMMGAAAGGLLSKVLIDKGILPKPAAMVRAEGLAKARDAIQQDAADKGIDPVKDPKAFSDAAARYFMGAKYPGSEGDALKAIQWGLIQEANQRSAALETANIEKTKAETAFYNRRPGGDTAAAGMTSPVLSVRAVGRLTGNPQVDAMSPAEAKQALKNIQPMVTVQSVDAAGNVQLTNTSRIDAAGSSADTGLNTRVANLSDTVVKTRIAAAAPALKRLDAAIDTYDKTGDLPGVGGLDNLPVAQFVKTPEGRYIQSMVSRLFNEDLRQASGVAVTPWEEQRKRAEQALGAANTAADYVRVYKDMIRPAWNLAVANTIASAGPDAVEAYKKRSKFDLGSLYNEKYATPGMVEAPGQQPAAANGVQEGATATNPTTKEKIIFKGGKWQPLK